MEDCIEGGMEGGIDAPMAESMTEDCIDDRIEPPENSEGDRKPGLMLRACTAANHPDSRLPLN